MYDRLDIKRNSKYFTLTSTNVRTFGESTCCIGKTNTAINGR